MSTTFAISGRESSPVSSVAIVASPRFVSMRSVAPVSEAMRSCTSFHVDTGWPSTESTVSPAARPRSVESAPGTARTLPISRDVRTTFPVAMISPARMKNPSRKFIVTPASMMNSRAAERLRLEPAMLRHRMRPERRHAVRVIVARTLRLRRDRRRAATPASATGFSFPPSMNAIVSSSRDAMRT